MVRRKCNEIMIDHYAFNEFKRRDKICLSNHYHIALFKASTAIHMYILLTRKICALCKLATCSRVREGRMTLGKICNRDSRSHEASHCLGIIITRLFVRNFRCVCVNCRFVTVGFYDFTYFSRCCLCTSRCTSFRKHRITVELFVSVITS